MAQSVAHRLGKLVLSIFFIKINDFASLDKLFEEAWNLSNHYKTIDNFLLKRELLNDNSEDENTISINDIDIMSGIEFEDFLFDYFLQNGYACKKQNLQATKELI